MKNNNVSYCRNVIQLLLFLSCGNKVLSFAWRTVHLIRNRYYHFIPNTSLFLFSKTCRLALGLLFCEYWGTLPRECSCRNVWNYTS